MDLVHTSFSDIAHMALIGMSIVEATDIYNDRAVHSNVMATKIII